jgi:hypothetical protein
MPVTISAGRKSVFDFSFQPLENMRYDIDRPAVAKHFIAL